MTKRLSAFYNRFMKPLFALSCLLWLTLVPAQAEVYRWVDEDGSVHFTDDPPPDRKAEPVDLPPLPETEIAQPRRPLADEEEEGASEEETEPAYEQFAITQPKDDTSVRANDGDIVVVLALAPGLNTAAGHEVVLLMDGEPVAQGPQTNFALSNVDRGTHRLRAEVQANGETLIATDPVTFTLHRHSILNP